MLGRTMKYLRTYAIVIGSVAAAALITWLLRPHMQVAVSIVFLGAVMVSAWYGGVVPGLTAAALSVASFEYLFRRTPQTIENVTEWAVRTIMFVAASLLVNYFEASLRNELKQVYGESLTDKLTGVGNRAAFDQRLAEEAHRSKRYQSPLSLLLIDVDRFKEVNDSFGHQAGDTFVNAIARALRSTRPSDFLARYGGDEFAVILPATDHEGACVMAERTRRAVAETSFPYGPLTVSIGISTLPPCSEDTFLLVAAADKALYAAKQDGRNRVKS
jgi:diguanylate cyclase (GGDEF)-like protein